VLIDLTYTTVHPRPALKLLHFQCQLRDGVELEDGMTQPAKVEIMDRKAVGATWVRIEITEGRNRQVRRMCDAIDHPVIKLMRTRYGGLNLGKLQRGEYRALASSEINRLEKLAGVTR
jgi:pseudouridine synthase